MNARLLLLAGTAACAPGEPLGSSTHALAQSITYVGKRKRPISDPAARI